MRLHFIPTLFVWNQVPHRHPEGVPSSSNWDSSGNENTTTTPQQLQTVSGCGSDRFTEMASMFEADLNRESRKVSPNNRFSVDRKKHNKRVIGFILPGLARILLLIVIARPVVRQLRNHHLIDIRLPFLVAVRHDNFMSWIEKLQHRWFDAVVVSIRQLQHDEGDKSKNAIYQEGNSITVPKVDCSQFIHHAAESLRSDGSTTTTNDMSFPWIDPYQGRIPSNIYTLPKPSPDNVKIGLYDKEYQFVQTEVIDPSSHITHMSQRKMLEILKQQLKHYNGQGDTQNKNQPRRPTMVQVGGQIGWFTFQASALGYNVHVLEANPIHVLRICRNIQLNGNLNNDSHAGDDTASPLVHLYHVSVLDEDAVESKIKNVDLSLRLGRGAFAHQYEFVPTLLQSGNGQLLHQRHEPIIYPNHQQLRRDSNAGNDFDDNVHDNLYLPIRQTTLDTWANQHSIVSTKDNTSVIDLLKLDVLEGQEIDILFGAKELIQSHKILNIMMDVQLLQEQDNSGNDGNRNIDPSLTLSSSTVITSTSPHAKMAKFLIDHGYQVHDKQMKTFLPVTQPHQKMTDDNAAAALDSVLEFMNRFCRSMGNRCHLWWKIPDNDERE